MTSIWCYYHNMYCLLKRPQSLFLKFCCDITEQWVSVFTPKWCRILQYKCKHDHSLLLMMSFHLISIYSTDHVSKAMLRLSLQFSYILEIWFLINLCFIRTDHSTTHQRAKQLKIRHESVRSNRQEEQTHDLLCFTGREARAADVYYY